ncbi:hypothetical protein [Actinomadura sp. 6N118]|uniref:hypothetical protein n=1 Tax=Actinomadura sp. 6N118 TaxID=3375151 RepID=UPI00378B0652
MSEQGTRPYGRDPQGVVWPDLLVVARPGTAAGATAVPSGMPGALPSAVPSAAPSGMPGALPSAVPSAAPGVMPGAVPSAAPGGVLAAQGSAGPGGTPGRQGGGRRSRRRAKDRRQPQWRFVAAGAAGVVTFAATLVGMNAVFGDEDGPPTAQALKACDAPGCVAPEVLPTTATPSSEEDVQPKTAKSTKRPSTTPSPTSPPTVKPQSSGPPSRPAPAPAPTPPEHAPRTAPPGPPVTVSYTGADSGYWEYRGTFTVTNRSGATLPPWRLAFNLPWHTRLRALWPFPWHHEGWTIVVNGGALANGASHTVTFLARGQTGSPVGCTINHSPCEPR